MSRAKYGVVVLVLALCSCQAPVPRTTGKGGSLTIESLKPVPVPGWVMSELNEVGFKGSLHSRALFACYNHSPKHVARSLSEMKEFTETKGCENWHFVGGVTKMERKLPGLKNKYPNLDASTFD